MSASSVYYPISSYYKQRFGAKVVKVPVSVVDTCPNRLGLKGMKTCVFCDEWGSAAYEKKQSLSLVDQIAEVQRLKASKNKAAKYLIYFQAYTSTFVAVEKLRAQFDLALTQPDVVGLVVGTRTDCISPALVRLWQEFSTKTYLSVEFGVQSFFDHHLKFLERGHDSASAIKVIADMVRGGTVDVSGERTIDVAHERTIDVAHERTIDIGVHLIFGLPHETDDEIVRTAGIINSLGVHNVKLHNLHVLKNTELENIYNRGEFVPLEIEEYARRVKLFISHLSPKIAIHRLGAVASRWEELVAPEWTRYHMRTYQYIVDYLVL